MKKIVAMMLLVSPLFVGCCNTSNEQSHKASQFDIIPSPTSEEPPSDEEPTTTPTGKSATETQAPVESDYPDDEDTPQSNSDPVAVTTAPTTVPPTVSANPPSHTQPKEPPVETTPAPAPTEPTPTEPTPTEPTAPETSRPDQDVEPTEPPATEPTGCTHEWECIHHSEEGHWITGLVCDCGWTVYGSGDEILALWNEHSASYPPAESMFEHGGYGSMDEWIVDTPAYDEWVCIHCGVTKP